MDRPKDAATPTPESMSEEFVGRWQTLVSATNWEKGRIISDWRESLIAAGVKAAQYSDECWSRTVGNVSPQHVGRLRRVHERFAGVAKEYPGLFWSHFQSALDWEDAEMWLQGAVQSKWSVSQMRDVRWEAIGAPPELKPRDEDVISSELDEDFTATRENIIVGTSEVVRDPADRGSKEKKRTGRTSKAGVSESAREVEALTGTERDVAARRASTAVDLAAWPEDLAESFDQFKLAILRHKLAGWEEVAADEILTGLASLEEIVRSETG